jgi:hypothetical protein
VEEYLSLSSGLGEAQFSTCQIGCQKLHSAKKVVSDRIEAAPSVALALMARPEAELCIRD